MFTWFCIPDVTRSTSYCVFEGFSKKDLPEFLRQKDEFEAAGVAIVNTFFLDINKNVMFVIIKTAGQAVLKSKAATAFENMFRDKNLSWYSGRGVMANVVDPNTRKYGQLGQTVPDISLFHGPNRLPGDERSENPSHPPLVIEIEWRSLLLDVLNKVNGVYFNPTFVGPNGSTVDEVWVLILDDTQLQQQVPPNLQSNQHLQSFTVAVSTVFVWPAQSGTMQPALPENVQWPAAPFLVAMSRNPVNQPEVTTLDWNTRFQLPACVVNARRNILQLEHSASRHLRDMGLESKEQGRFGG